MDIFLLIKELCFERQVQESIPLLNTWRWMFEQHSDQMMAFSYHLAYCCTLEGSFFNLHHLLSCERQFWSRMSWLVPPAMSYYQCHCLCHLTLCHLSKESKWYLNLNSFHRTLLPPLCFPLDLWLPLASLVVLELLLNSSFPDCCCCRVNKNGHCHFLNGNSHLQWSWGTLRYDQVLVDEQKTQPVWFVKRLVLRVVQFFRCMKTRVWLEWDQHNWHMAITKIKVTCVICVSAMS